MENQLYSTGEFAELCGVKKQTLFHYDEIGLLTPIEVEENGYRRYSYEQYQTFLLISCLKEAGMQLSEIKEFLDNEDEDERRRTIEFRIAALDQRISYLMRVRKILSGSFSTLGIQSGIKEGNDDEIRLIRRPEITLWATERLDLMDDKTLVEDVARLVKTVEPHAVALASEDVMKGIYDNQQHLLIMQSRDLSEEDAKDLGLHPFVRPAGRYGITNQQPGESAEDAYKRLIDSMEAFAEVPGPYFYEEYPSDGIKEADAPLTIAVQLIETEDSPGF